MFLENKYAEGHYRDNLPLMRSKNECLSLICPPDFEFFSGKIVNLRGLPRITGELIYLKNRELVKSANFETANFGDPLYIQVCMLIDI